MVTASARSLPALMYSIEAGMRSNMHLHLPAEQIGQRRRRAAIGHVDHVDAGHHLEQLAGDMLRRAVAGRRHVDLAGIGFGIGDELGNRLGRNRWIDLHDDGHADDARDRRDVADEIEIELVVERRVDRVRRRWPAAAYSRRAAHARPPRWRYCCRRPAGSR